MGNALLVVDRALVTPADGRGFISFDPVTGAGAECCCEQEEPPNPCCMRLGWRECSGSVTLVPNFASSALDVTDYVTESQYYYYTLYTQFFADREEFHQKIRFYGVPQQNGTCRFFEHCLEFTHRIVRTWQVDGSGEHEEGEQEVLQDIRVCANPNPVPRGSFLDISGSCRWGIPSGGTGCRGSYASGFTSWNWDIICTHFATSGTSTRIETNHPYNSTHITTYSQTISALALCNGVVAPGGPDVGGSVPLDPGIQAYIERLQAGCRGCGEGG